MSANLNLYVYSLVKMVKETTGIKKEKMAQSLHKSTLRPFCFLTDVFEVNALIYYRAFINDVVLEGGMG